ncbi:MAG: EutN/CcmL family microcompartment protein [Limnochordia bacterium]|nr:EutN/CcmL family microcompartment protein [Limnochordia bacterium]
MILARVIQPIVCTYKHEAYAGKKFYLLKQVDAEGNETGEYELAVDYVGAGPGDLVLAGGVPGVASEVFSLEKAPIQTLIMAIVDAVE